MNVIQQERKIHHSNLSKILFPKSKTKIVDGSALSDVVFISSNLKQEYCVIVWTNLILVPKINWWFVFIILICGRRERSKKNHFMHLRTAIYENWNNITCSTKNNHQPKFSRHSFYFLYGTKPRKSMTGLKRQICRLIKRSNIRGKKPYSDHNIAVIILENKTQK